MNSSSCMHTRGQFVNYVRHGSMWSSFLLCCSVLLGPSSFHGAVSFYGEGVHGAGSYEATLTHLRQSGGQSVNFVVPWTVTQLEGT